MKKILLCVSILAEMISAQAQSFEPIVVGSSGTSATSSSVYMEWTIGEVMTETYTTTSNFFTQGFHQPLLLVTEITELKYLSAFIYPNPVRDNLFIDLPYQKGNVTITIFDLQGKLLHSEINSSLNKLIKIPFYEFSKGMYLLTISDNESKEKNSYKIIK